MLFLTFLIAGGMAAGYNLRIARLDGRYAATNDALEDRIDSLIRDLEYAREWAKKLEVDAIKNQTYTPRQTRAFSGD